MKKLLTALLVGLACRVGLADEKISAMSSTSTLNSFDIVPVVTNPSGSAANFTISAANLASTLIATSTGPLQSQVTSIAAATGTIQSQLTSVAAATGTIQTQLTSVAASTGSIQSQVNAKVSYSSFSATVPILYNNATGAISATQISLSSSVVGVLPVANGGTGTASPGLVAGTNITSITGTWPNQTINAATQAGGGGSGTINLANQTDIGYYSGTGSSTTISGADDFTWTSPVLLLNDSDATIQLGSSPNSYLYTSPADLFLEADSGRNVVISANGARTLVIGAGGSFGTLTASGTLNMSANPIINVTDPTNPQDVATKHYVDTTSGGGGGGASTLAISAGVQRSSPTTDVIFPSSEFKGSISADSMTVTVNTSSFTLQGPIVSSITLASMYGAPTLTGTNFTALPGSQVGSGVPAANIASGSLGASVIASSLTLASMYGAPTLTGTNITAIPTASISSGNLGAGVILINQVSASTGIAKGTLAAGIILGNQVSLSTGVVGTIQAGNFPALTGDITTSAGSLATTAAALQSNITTFGSSITVNGTNGELVKYGMTAGSTTATSEMVIPYGTGKALVNEGDIPSIPPPDNSWRWTLRRRTWSVFRPKP